MLTSGCRPRCRWVRVGGQGAGCRCELAEPWLRTVALRVNEAPAVGLLLLTVGASTTRSVTVTAAEQLLPVSVSPLTLSTQAP